MSKVGDSIQWNQFIPDDVLELMDESSVEANWPRWVRGVGDNAQRFAWCQDVAVANQWLDGQRDNLGAPLAGVQASSGRLRVLKVDADKASEDPREALITAAVRWAENEDTDSAALLSDAVAAYQSSLVRAAVGQDYNTAYRALLGSDAAVDALARIGDVLRGEGLL